MGKNQSASGLTNIIQYDNNGNVSFVSGSTTLMQISSSGAITTTGVISGSNALSSSYSLNSGLLNSTGSVGFATTGSLLTVSSSQQQISASYIALSASYNTFSGSASTRITENSSSIQQVSSSQQQISASLLNVISIFATTGSNSFKATQSITGSLTVTGQIIAQTLNVQQVTSSIIYSSGSNNFGCDLNSRQTFTGSVLITGSLTIAGASSATSYSGTTIYGSTVVCSPVGKFTSCIDAGSGTFSSCVTATQFNVSTSGGTTQIYNTGGGHTVITNATANKDMNIQTSGTGGQYFNTAGADRLIISSTGAATFACSVAAASIQISQDSNSELQLLTINNQNCKGTSSVTRMDIGNWVAQYALTIGRNGICTTGTRFGDNQANTTFIFDNAVSSCGMYIGNASSGGNLHLITGGYKRLSIDSNGVSTFACTICAPNVDITGQIKRIDTIYLGGSLNGTGNVTAACYQIESAYALASGRTSVSKGGQYASSAYYVLLAAPQDVYVYYKLALIQSSYFCGYTRFVNSQDGSTRTGISQYSFDNGGTWTTLGTTSFGPGYGYAAGGVATPSGNYSGVVVFRAAFTSGAGNTLIGIDQLYFMSCGYGMYFINNLG